MADIVRSTAPLGERVRDLELIERALRRAVREALRRHKQAGNPVAVWRGDGIAWIAPAEIPVSTQDQS